MWVISSAPALYLFWKMLLRTLWCRLGTQLSAERKPVYICALTSISQSPQQTKYESKPRTGWIHAKSCFDPHHYQKTQTVGRGLTSSGGFKGFVSASLTCGAAASWGQTRLYSTNPVKLMLKPNLKPTLVPGKRIPKGPRTKQPSRTNQPSLKEDKVPPRPPRLVHCVLCDDNSNLLLSVGYDAMYCFCNSRSVSLTDTLP